MAVYQNTRDIFDYRFLGIWIFLNLLPNMLQTLGIEWEAHSLGFLNILYYLIINILIPIILMLIWDNKYCKSFLIKLFYKFQIAYFCIGISLGLISVAFLFYQLLPNA